MTGWRAVRHSHQTILLKGAHPKPSALASATGQVPVGHSCGVCLLIHSGRGQVSSHGQLPYLPKDMTCVGRGACYMPDIAQHSNPSSVLLFWKFTRDIHLHTWLLYHNQVHPTRSASTDTPYFAGTFCMQAMASGRGAPLLPVWAPFSLTNHSPPPPRPPPPATSSLTQH